MKFYNKQADKMAGNRSWLWWAFNYRAVLNTLRNRADNPPTALWQFDHWLDKRIDPLFSYAGKGWLTEVVLNPYDQKLSKFRSLAAEWGWDTAKTAKAGQLILRLYFAYLRDHPEFENDAWPTSLRDLGPYAPMPVEHIAQTLKKVARLTSAGIWVAAAALLALTGTNLLEWVEGLAAAGLATGWVAWLKSWVIREYLPRLEHERRRNYYSVTTADGGLGVALEEVCEYLGPGWTPNNIAPSTFIKLGESELALAEEWFAEMDGEIQASLFIEMFEKHAGPNDIRFARFTLNPIVLGTPSNHVRVETWSRTENRYFTCCYKDANREQPDFKEDARRVFYLEKMRGTHLTVVDNRPETWKRQEPNPLEGWTDAWERETVLQDQRVRDAREEKARVIARKERSERQRATRRSRPAAGGYWNDGGYSMPTPMGHPLDGLVHQDGTVMNGGISGRGNVWGSDPL